MYTYEIYTAIDINISFDIFVLMGPADFQQRTGLAAALQQHLSNLEGTQVAKAKALGISQPRLSDLLRNRIEKFSLDALVSLAQKAGLRLDLIAQEVQLPPTSGMRIANTGATGDSPFPVEPSELARLGAIEATKLFVRLLRCDVFSVGLTPKDVILSLDTSKKDGGIDAKVEKTPKSSGLLAFGDTHFQIKTGSSFKPWQRSCLIKELFGKSSNKPSIDLLGPALKDCLEAGGTYTLVVFGYDLLPNQHTVAVKTLVSLFKEVGFANPKVDVLGQGQIAGEIERYPSVYRDLFGLANDSLFTVRTWRTQSLMQQPLVIGDEQEKLINEIRDILKSNSSTFIRLVGEPGIGKTRLVLEAVSDEAVAPTVVYAPTGEAFQESRLFKDLIQSEIEFYLTIVIDDCDDRDRASILAVLKNKPSIRLVMIDHGPAHANDSEMRIFQCPQLGRDQVEQILESYLGDGHDLSNWADICDGSPRVAHAIGQNLKENPDDVLRQPSSVPIWDRFIVGYEEAGSRIANEYRIVLRHIALFTKFGFESPVHEEGQFIARLVQRADPQITYARFQEIVQHFRGRRILQGSHTLFLVPRALQIHLWLEYWTNYGRGFEFQSFMKEVPSTMRDWFLRLFTYAHKPETARAVVRSILSSDGPFADEALVESEIGPRLLRYLAEADPVETLSCIERTYGSWDLPRLRSWHSGRLDIVRALEYISVWDTCYERATRVLIKLALVENSDYSNNSTGTLKGLFAIGLGWAATQASPEVRFRVLKELVTSRDDAAFRLGLECAKEWLSTYGGYRVIGPEHQGLRPTIEFWRPKTYGDIYNAWRSVWRLLCVEINGAESIRKDQIASVLVESAEGLIQIESLSEEVTATLFSLAKDNSIEKRPLVSLVIRLLKYRCDDMPRSSVDRIIQLDETLTGSTLWDRISRYVLHTNWDEDYSLDGDEVSDSDLPLRRCVSLAQEMMLDNDILAENLRGLLTSSGHKLPTLGVECGKLAFDEELDGLILSATSESLQGINAEFLGGFLKGVRTINEERWEGLLHSLLDNAKTRVLGTQCIACSGLSESIISKLVTLYSTGEVDAAVFDRFALRLPESSVSEQSFLSLVDALLERSRGRSASTAVGLIQEYYLHGSRKSDLPRERSLTALKLATEDDEGKNPMRSYYWGELAKAHLEVFPDDQLELLNAILTSGKLRHYNNSEAIKIATEIVVDDPDGAWSIISALLENDGRQRYDILHWLGDPFGNARAARPPSCFLPTEAIIDWAKKDPDKRVGHVLQLLPKTLDPNDGGHLTCRFVEEFGDDSTVSAGMVGHFWAGSWSGPESLKLERDRDRARNWLTTAASQPVRSWLSHFILTMDNRIRDARIREEREF